MIVLEAKVKSFLDDEKEGTIRVVRFENTEKEERYEVYYTSPYGSIGKDKKPGMFAVPSPGQQVLIIQPDESSTWYFLSVIQSGPLKDKTNMPESVYGKRKAPGQFILRDPTGNELMMSHEYNKKGYNTKVKLKSSLGKKLVLNDSPKINHISLENESGDGIKIRGKYQRQPLMWPPPPPTRSIDISCKGMLNMTSREGGINMTLNDGKDISIRNSSTGYNVMSAKWTSEETWARTPLIIPYGNVNISSDFRDVNITAGKTHSFVHQIFPPLYQSRFLLYKDVFRGKILLKARGAGPRYLTGDSEGVMGPVIQLASDGAVIIKSLTGKIYIKGDVVNIRGDREVNIESRGNIQMNAGDFLIATANTNAGAAGDAGAFGLLPGRPVASAPDAVKNLYESGLHAITEINLPRVKTPFATQFMMGGPTGNVIIDGRIVTVHEQVARPIYQSVPRIPLIEARKAGTPPVILSDEEKQIV